MNVRQLCISATVMLLVFPNILAAEDASSSNNQEYEDNGDDDDDDTDNNPPENVDFESFQNWSDEEMNERGQLAGPATVHCPPPARQSTHELCSQAACTHELCSQAACTHDTNCSSSAADNSTTLKCCFNGCIRACLVPMDAPPVFDWIEKPTHMERIAPSEARAHSGAAESMALPGGCIVSTMQYSKLETFKMNQHVSHCFCDIGGIFCKIAES